MCDYRRVHQQQEWEERQAERKARQAEMAGEPFDKEVSCFCSVTDLTLCHLHSMNCTGLVLSQVYDDKLS